MEILVEMLEISYKTVCPFRIYTTTLEHFRSDSPDNRCGPKGANKKILHLTGCL